MIVRVLGSAAAEGFPGLFCVCPICEKARALGSKNIRRRTAYLVGETVMVDWGPDAYHSMIALGVDYAPLRHLLISHSHQDHWMPEDLAFRRRGFSVIPAGSQLTVHGNEAVRRKLLTTLPDLQTCYLGFERAEALNEYDLGDGVVAVPLPANHAPDEEAFTWLVRTRSGTVLFGNDTGWYPSESWDFLSGEQLSVVFMDSTSGRVPTRDHHLGCAAVVEVREMMRKMGVLKSDARFIACHFSHNGGMLHEELEEFYGPHGIEVAYDGMQVVLG
jgi:phosphoribosyl 1,2-cyclic phosphate phosphodiesterase